MQVWAASNWLTLQPAVEHRKEELIWFDFNPFNRMWCTAFPMALFKCGWTRLFLPCQYLITCYKFGRMIHPNSPKSGFQKKINMQLLCQTVGRNGFILQRALWQVHCGRIDSYMGGKWIVITCLFPVTLGWVPSDLLQEFWIGLLPSLRLAADSPD